MSIGKLNGGRWLDSEPEFSRGFPRLNTLLCGWKSFVDKPPGLRDRDRDANGCSPTERISAAGCGLRVVQIKRSRRGTRAKSWRHFARHLPAASEETQAGIADAKSGRSPGPWSSDPVASAHYDAESSGTELPRLTAVVQSSAFTLTRKNAVG